MLLLKKSSPTKIWKIDVKFGQINLLSMKKFFIGILFCLGTFSASSQITITSSDFGSIGDQFILGLDNAPGIQPGPAGAGQTWDFRGLITTSLDTLMFVDPATVPAAQGLTNCNLVTESNDGYFFLNKGSSAVKTVALGTDVNGVPTIAVYQPEQILLPFPSQLNTQVTSTSSFNTAIYLGLDTNILGCQLTFDSTRINRRTTLNTVFDASGTVYLPTDTIQTLRAKSDELTTDSIFVYNPNTINCLLLGINMPAGWNLMPQTLAQLAGLPGNVVTGTTTVYTWYANGEKFGVVALRLDDQGIPDNARFKSDASQLSVSPVTAPELSVYPNPATKGLINIQGMKSTAQICVADLSGRVHAVKRFGTEQIDASNLGSGIYLFTILEQGQAVARGRFVIQ